MATPPALRHKSFVVYLSGSFISNIGNNMQVWGIAWHIFHLTQSSFMVGLVGLFRIVPLLLLTLFGGVLADRIDRRKLLFLSQAGMALVALLLLVLTLNGLNSVWPLYGIVVLNAIARAFDGPARQSFQVGLVPLEDFPNATSINGMAWRLSDILGPAAAGLLIALPQHGLAWCYGLNFISFLAIFISILYQKPAPPMVQQGSPQSFREVVSLVKEGLDFVNRTPVVRSAMWIDFWATLLSGAEALLPAFAGAILKLGPQGFGILASATGVGAFVAATAMAWLPTVRSQGKMVVTMIFFYGLATIGFGCSQTLVTACFCLALVGASDMISTVLRQTIRQLATPDELRGRMTATSSLFHISGPQLGDFEAGAIAGLKGERFSIVLGGGLCLFVALYYTKVKALMNHTIQR